MDALDPHPDFFHRHMGSHAPAIHRLLYAVAFGVVAGALVVPFQPWQIGVLVGWDVSGALLLVLVWHTIWPADATETAAIATREDETRSSARLLLNSASLAS